MNRTRTALSLALALGALGGWILLGTSGDGGGRRRASMPAAFAPAPEPAATEASPTVNGLDFTGLSPAQIQTITQILSENGCNCGCGMNLLECRSKDPNCSRSLSLDRQVVQEIREGKDRSTVTSNLKAALAKLAAPAPAAPAVDASTVYKIDTTSSPSKGPKGAPVTIVEFSDFQ